MSYKLTTADFFNEKMYFLTLYKTKKSKLLKINMFLVIKYVEKNNFVYFWFINIISNNIGTSN